jgi:hypothetical protein
LQELNDIGGGSLLQKYNRSVQLLLSEVYPDYNWLPWKFAKSADNIWDDKKIQRKFLDWAAKELNVKEMSDWYRVTNKVTRYHNI